MRKGCSEKSYVVSICLAGVFGTVGIHHFYVERWLHGLFDLGLFVLTIFLLFNGQLTLGFFTLLIDIIHTVYVTYKLIVGEYKDGSGKLICIPNWFANLRTRHFNKIIKKSILSNKTIIHDLRHTFASINLMEGVPVLVVSNHLGHSSPSITLDIYSHFIPEVAEIPSITFERVLKEANNNNN